MMRTRTVTIYKDRVGSWRWKITARNGRKIGASSESFEARKKAASNLFEVTGIRIESPRHRHGKLWQRFSLLARRTLVPSLR